MFHPVLHHNQFRSSLLVPSLQFPKLMRVSLRSSVRTGEVSVALKVSVTLPEGNSTTTPWHFALFSNLTLFSKKKVLKFSQMEIFPTSRYPDSVLVRENMKAYVSKSDDIETIQEKSRTIAVGEVTIFSSYLFSAYSTHSLSMNPTIPNMMMMLRCLFLWVRCWEFEAKPRLGSSAASTRLFFLQMQLQFLSTDQSFLSSELFLLFLDCSVKHACLFHIIKCEYRRVKMSPCYMRQNKNS